MGGGAYGSLASMFEARREAAVFSELYDELARKFSLNTGIDVAASPGTTRRVLCRRQRVVQALVDFPRNRRQTATSN
jgi:hypothetical protein